jgi:hypothetical protein
MTDTTSQTEPATAPIVRPVRAVRITPDGALELVDVYPDPSDIARQVDGVGPSDVTARATWPVHGDVLTVWTAKSAPRSHANDLARRVVGELLPRLPGPIDRVWERVQDDPIAGPALVTGYRPRTEEAPGATVALSAGAVDRIRAVADGRKAHRQAARENAEAAAQGAVEAATAAVPIPAPTNTIPTPPDGARLPRRPAKAKAGAGARKRR